MRESDNSPSQIDSRKSKNDLVLSGSNEKSGGGTVQKQKRIQNFFQQNKKERKQGWDSNMDP